MKIISECPSIGTIAPAPLRLLLTVVQEGSVLVTRARVLATLLDADGRAKPTVFRPSRYPPPVGPFELSPSCIQPAASSQPSKIRPFCI
eukprot:5881949-Pleurochrysis_carterae.AAC.1